MRITAVVSQKGGVGKTSTALALATLTAAAGDRTLVVDVDPQASASWWASMLDTLGEPAPFEVVADTDPAVLGRLREAEGAFDSVWVDTPGSLEGSDVLRTVLAAADFVVLPTPPTTFDLQATIATVEQLVAPSGVPYRVLLNKVDSRAPREALDAQELLGARGIDAFRSSVRLLKAHSDGIRDGRLVTEARDESQRKVREDWQGVTLELLAQWSRSTARPAVTA